MNVLTVIRSMYMKYAPIPAYRMNEIQQALWRWNIKQPGWRV